MTAVVPSATYLRLFVALAIGASVLALGISPVGACTCGGITMESAIVSHDIVFVGEVVKYVTEGDSGGTWTFDVTTVVKGEVDAQVVVVGDDWSSGCGTDFASLPQPTVVLAEMTGGRLMAAGCAPAARGDQLDALLTPLPAPTGEGPVAALVTLRHKWANLIALDDQGRVLSWGEVPGELLGVAHCRGSSIAAVLNRTQKLVFVDLETMAIVDRDRIDISSFFGG